MLFPIDINSPSRKFPHYGWAWPNAYTEQLLQAAAMKDERQAKLLFRDWMVKNNIDEVSWKEQRLLLPIAARFSESDISVPNRARLNGLVRMFWTRSRLSLRASEPAVQKLVSEGIDVLLFKGAARAASSQNNMKGRIVSDVDIMVRPDQFKPAFQILYKDGWKTKNGRSLCYAQTLAQSIVGLNFIKGEYGDIDLHQSLFRVLGKEQSLDEGVWARSSEIEFMGSQVRIPCMTDMLLIAIAHGSVDGHRHSDWVIDCDWAVSSGKIDWQLFIELIQERELAPNAAIVLSFLSQRLQSNIPVDVLEEVGRLGRQSIPGLVSALLQARPLTDHNIISNLGRSYFKRASKKKKRNIPEHLKPNTLSLIKMSKSGKLNGVGENSDGSDVAFNIEVPPETKGLTIVVKTSISVPKRRCVYELNTRDTHIARLMYRHSGAEGQYLLKAKIPLPESLRSLETRELIFESRPRKLLVLGEEPGKEEALNKLPFSIHSIDFW